MSYGAASDRCAYFAGKTKHVANVVNTAQAIIKLFLSSRKMMYIPSTVVPTGITITSSFDWTALATETRCFNADTARACEKSSVTCHTGR